MGKHEERGVRQMCGKASLNIDDKRAGNVCLVLKKAGPYFLGGKIMFLPTFFSFK